MSGALIALDESPAARAFHAVHDAAQILRGDLLDEQDKERARELLGQASEHISALYLDLIRTERRVVELSATRAFLDTDPEQRRAAASGGK